MFRMNFIKETGIVYDSIYLGITMLNGFNNKSNYNEYGHTNIKEYLYPFFYSDLKRSSLIEYFKLNIFDAGYYKNGMTDFINTFNDKVRFKSFILSYILHDSYCSEIDYNNTDIEKLEILLKELGYNAAIIKSYISLIENFDEYKDKLIKFLNDTYPVVIEIHQYNDRHIQECVSNLNTQKSIRNICRRHNIDNKTIKNANIAISLIDKYAFISNTDEKINSDMYIMGINSHRFSNLSFMGGDPTIIDSPLVSIVNFDRKFNL